MRIRATLVIGVVVAALVAPASSDATVTIGPNLASLTPSNTGYSCNPTHNCTLVNGSVGPGFGPPGLISPVSGSITDLRIRTGPGGADGIIFRQLRPLGGAYKDVATFGVVPATLPPNSTIHFPSFPIEVGDAIGVNCCGGGGDDITTATVAGSGDFLVWGTGANPLLGNGETRVPDFDKANALLMLNADIEPENHFLLDIGKVKAKRVLATATVPNAGVLTVGSKLLKRTTVNAPAPAPGQRALFSEEVPLSVKTTKAGRARLRRAGKLKLNVAYTPIFGTATSQRLTAKR